MGFLKNEKLHVGDFEPLGYTQTFKINISSDGLFYCYIPHELFVIYSKMQNQTLGYWVDNKTDAVSSCTYAGLLEGLEVLMYSKHTPETKIEHVIQYIIESSARFAEDKKGNIFSNAAPDSAEWTKEKDNRYEGNRTTFERGNGYSLCVGARAKTKTTLSYGGVITKVTYENYYRGGNHHNRDNPAELLNSWVDMNLGSEPKETPYTDEAALFFYNLIFRMAKISKIIQNATFEENDLLRAISYNMELPPPLLFEKISA